MFEVCTDVYMDAVMKEVNIGIGRKEESGDCLAYCIQLCGRSKEFIPKGDGGHFVGAKGKRYMEPQGSSG